jgi:hypothetical protein
MNSLSTFGVKCHMCEKYLGRKIHGRKVWVELSRRQTVADWNVKAPHEHGNKGIRKEVNLILLVFRAMFNHEDP